MQFPHPARGLPRFLEELPNQLRNPPLHLTLQMINMPNQAAIIGVNEVLKQIWRNNNFEHNFFTYFGCASIAGAFAAFITMPLDNIRTRMNTQCDLLIQKSSSLPSSNPPTSTIRKKLEKKGRLAKMQSQSILCECVETRGCIKYNTPVETYSQIMSHQGIRGFYKGFYLRCITQSTATAISWTTYEMIKKRLSSNDTK